MLPGSKSLFRQLILASSMLLVALALAALAGAMPVTVSVVDQPTPCDRLFGSPSDELGNPPAFPPDEVIASSDAPTSLIACIPGGSSVLVSMTNLTTRDFPHVWYVSDAETSLFNVDGLINGEEAFKIDVVGVNQPLIFESMTVNGIFEAGETWEFIIDDYFNTLGLPASALASAGLVGSLSGGDFVSSGSIIATEEPAPPVPSLSPTGAALLGGLVFAIALGGLAVQRRRSPL